MTRVVFRARPTAPATWLRRLGRSALVLVAAVVSLHCDGEPPFVLHVTWPEPVPVTVGSKVIYGGLPIGEVERVALRQPQPDHPARVAVSLVIDSKEVVLREGDQFHLGVSGGEPVVEVRPSQEPSSPLASGATVAGVPPFLTWMEGRLDEAVESLGEIAFDVIDEALEALEQNREGEPPPDAPGPDPTPPR